MVEANLLVCGYMPIRPSAQTLGSTVGKRLFGTANASMIQRKIQSIDKDALRAALKAQGIKGGMTARKIAETLTGKNSAGSARHLGRTVKALQSTGVTNEATESMGKIMMDSTKRAVQDEQIKATAARPSVLNLAQGSIGARVAASRMAREGGDVSEKPLEQARSIAEIRETLRSLGINDRRILPRPGFGKPEKKP